MSGNNKVPQPLQGASRRQVRILDSHSYQQEEEPLPPSTGRTSVVLGQPGLPLQLGHTKSPSIPQMSHQKALKRHPKRLPSGNQAPLSTRVSGRVWSLHIHPCLAVRTWCSLCLTAWFQWKADRKEDLKYQNIINNQIKLKITHYTKTRNIST